MRRKKTFDFTESLKVTSATIEAHKQAKTDKKLFYIAKPGFYAYRSCRIKMNVPAYIQKQGCRLYTQLEYETMLKEYNLSND